MAVNVPYKLEGQNKWMRRKIEFLAGHWVTRGEYFREKKLAWNGQSNKETETWDLDKNAALHDLSDATKMQVIEANVPIKIASLNGKTRVVQEMYQMVMAGGTKDLKMLALAYHIFKVELGEPENITRNLNEAVSDILPDDVLDKLKENALNAASGYTDLPRLSDQTEEA